MNRRALIKPAGKAFNYFGYKGRDAKMYPVPRFDCIIEPFAGGAGYALTYPDLKVTLYDLDEEVCELWDYLIHASPADILALPLIKPYQHVDELKVNGAAKQLIRRWLNPLSGKAENKIPPMKVKWDTDGSIVTEWAVWGDKRRNMISKLVTRIKHWRILNRSYIDADDSRGTWFIDPPYASKVSKNYKYTHKSIDYKQLSEWCQNRQGQTIVCENTDSERWLPFRDLHQIKGGNYKGSKAKRSTELIWCSDERDYPMTQSSLL